MRNAKAHKTLLAVLVSVLMLAVAMFAILTTQTGKVNAAVEAGSYFTGVDSVTFKDNKVVATITGDSTSREELADPDDEDSKKVTVEENVLAFKNQLIVNDFDLMLDVPTDKFDKVTIVFENDAYYANGNVVKGELKDKVANKLVLDYTDGTVYFNVKPAAAYTFDKTTNEIYVETMVDDGYLYANVGGVGYVGAGDVSEQGEVTEYRKIKSVNGMSAATVKFEFDLKDGATSADFGIVSVSQHKGNDTYTQTFEIENGNLKNKAYPRVAINEDFYKLNKDGSYSVKKSVMTAYTVSVKTYSVLGDVTSGDIFVKVADAYKDSVWFDPSADGEPKTFAFKQTGIYEIQLAESDTKVYETITGIESINFDSFADTNEPEYITPEAGAIASYELALKKAYYDEEGKHHKPLGTSITLPSLKDYVFDDMTAYEDLEETVYYNTDTQDSATSSSLSLTLSEAGNYEYYVTFEDKAGNKTENNYFVPDKDDKTTDDGKYAAFIFKFHMVDDAPITIEAPVKQGKGFKGISYTASKFDVDAAGCTTTYELYYNADEDAAVEDEGWVAIPKASTVTSEEYDENGFTYEQVQAIAYAGGLTFTPDRLGSYMIKCSATSSSSSRSATEYSVIRVLDEPETVKIPSTWLKDNVWSVVFLSIGTLCLVGIIVLLCIKPKEETEGDNE